MLFFVTDPARALTHGAVPGPGRVVVIADETVGYTGRIVQAFVTRAVRPVTCAPSDAMVERRRLVGSPTDGDGEVVAVLHGGGACHARDHLPASRLYGHSLATRSRSAITVLSQVDGLRKFEVAADLLQNQPEAVDLRMRTRAAHPLGVTRRSSSPFCASRRARVAGGTP
jgi:hypothetical protein